jgi:hypothetical protein
MVCNYAVPISQNHPRNLRGKAKKREKARFFAKIVNIKAPCCLTPLAVTGQQV